MTKLAKPARPRTERTPCPVHRRLGRIRQLERCLNDVRRILSDNFIDLNGHGADTMECSEFRLNQRITNRINRTLK